MSGETETRLNVRLAVLYEAESLADEDQRERIGEAVTFGPFSDAEAIRFSRLLRGGAPMPTGRGGRVDVSLLPCVAPPERTAEGGEDE